MCLLPVKCILMKRVYFQLLIMFTTLKINKMGQKFANISSLSRFEAFLNGDPDPCPIFSLENQIFSKEKIEHESGFLFKVGYK